MRQVPYDAGSPVHHLLIGNGRLARHLSHYFTLEGISFSKWIHARQCNHELAEIIRASEKPVTHIWVLISDDAIPEIVEWINALGVQAQILHASGAKVIKGARSVHPLMTFGTELYSLDSYQRIPFVVEPLYDGVSIEEILGGLKNAAVFLPPEKRTLYHSLVSASGNFPALLWVDVFERFEKDLSLPREILAPFLFQTLTNVIRSGERAVTGPLVRGDFSTIRAHEAALAGTPLGELYAAFLKYFKGASDVRHEITH